MMSETVTQLSPAAAPFIPQGAPPSAPAYGMSYGGYGAAVAPSNQFNGSSAGYEYANAASYGAAIYPSGAYPPTSGAQDFNPHGRQGGQGGRGPGQKVFHPPLPENERCTLKCTKIPDYVTEQDLRDDFEEYGHIVELQLTPVPERDNDAEQGDNAVKKRTYLECMVQYYSAANAKKRLHSDKAVLDNRFIQTRPAFFNLVPPAEVPYPGDAVVERDAAIVAGTHISKPKPGVGQKKPYNAGGAVFRGGANKYMRTAGTENASAASEAELAMEYDAAESGGGGSSHAAVPPAAPLLTQEKVKVMQDFDQLKTLRQQAEEIARRKEEILLVSLWRKGCFAVVCVGARIG
jgi:RNA recognition motif-containing protein